MNRNTAEKNLDNRIRERLTQGPLSFAEYMHMALYEPGLGYYVGGSAKIGSSGDFITAPEISPLFSRALANQCADLLKAIGDGACILEYGAGTGRMACDLLNALETERALPQHYYIIEVSPELIERQKQRLADHPALLARVSWVSRCPQHFRGIVLANEVLDAMPVELFQYRDHAFWRGEVMEQKEGFGLDFSCPAVVSPTLESRAWDWPSGYTSEYNPHLNAWFSDLFQRVQEGACLLIDYGFSEAEYYHPDRSMGTLVCHRRHQVHTDFFSDMGCQDITAHVDFTAVATAASLAGFSVCGYIDQANFLLNCGILDLAARTEDAKGALRQSQALQQLLMPSEMGELCKVMALGKRIELSWRGFHRYDKRARL